MNELLTNEIKVALPLIASLLSARTQNHIAYELITHTPCSTSRKIVPKMSNK